MFQFQYRQLKQEAVVMHGRRATCRGRDFRNAQEHLCCVLRSIPCRRAVSCDAPTQALGDTRTPEHVIVGRRRSAVLVGIDYMNSMNDIHLTSVAQLVFERREEDGLSVLETTSTHTSNSGNIRSLSAHLPGTTVPIQNLQTKLYMDHRL